MTTELTQVKASWLAVLVLGLCTLFGCSSPRAEATVYIDEKKIPADMVSDYQSFAINCSKCHSLARVFGAHVTQTSHWDLYVARMMRTAGSAISPAERPHILRFLYWYTDTYMPAERAAGEEAASDAISSQNLSAPATDKASAPAMTDTAIPPPSTSAESSAAPEASPSATEVPATPPAEVQ